MLSFRTPLAAMTSGTVTRFFMIRPFFGEFQVSCTFGSTSPLASQITRFQHLDQLGQRPVDRGRHMGFLAKPNNGTVDSVDFRSLPPVHVLPHGRPVHRRGARNSQDPFHHLLSHGKFPGPPPPAGLSSTAAPHKSRAARLSATPSVSDAGQGGDRVDARIDHELFPDEPLHRIARIRMQACPAKKIHRLVHALRRRSFRLPR